MDAEALVNAYLGELEAAAAELPAHRRAELVGDLREHVGLAVAEAGQADVATVRMILERLGSPAEIVAIEAGQSGLPPFGQRHHGARAIVDRALDPEPLSLLLLTVGAVLLPFLGPVLGLWVMAEVPRWTLTQKRTATLIVLVGSLVPAWILLPSIASGEWTAIIQNTVHIYALVPLAGMVAAGYLIVSSSIGATSVRRQ
jgi:hypothetical protein